MEFTITFLKIFSWVVYFMSPLLVLFASLFSVVVEKGINVRSRNQSY